MTSTCLDWLPLQAIGDPRLSKILEDAIAAWAGRWFAGDHYRAGSVRVREHSSLSGKPPCWISRGHSIAFDMEETILLNLAKHALDADGKSEICPVDHELLLSFSREMIDDLSRELEKVLGISHSHDGQLRAIADPSVEHGGLEIEMSYFRSSVSFRIAIGRSALVPLRKSLVRSMPGKTLEKTELISILADETVSFTVSLGTAEIPFADARALDVGDVLVLDTALGDRVPFVSRHGKGVIGTVKLGHMANQIQLIVSMR